MKNKIEKQKMNQTKANELPREIENIHFFRQKLQQQLKRK